LVKTLKDETDAGLQVALKKTWTLKFGYGMHAEAFTEDPVLGPIHGRGFSRRNKFEAVTNAITDWCIVLMEKAIADISPEKLAEMVADLQLEPCGCDDSCGCRSGRRARKTR
jgi:hypothetical protein